MQTLEGLLKAMGHVLDMALFDIGAATLAWITACGILVLIYRTIIATHLYSRESSGLVSLISLSASGIGMAVTALAYTVYNNEVKVVETSRDMAALIGLPQLWQHTHWVALGSFVLLLVGMAYYFKFVKQSARYTRLRRCTMFVGFMSLVLASASVMLKSCEMIPTAMLTLQNFLDTTISASPLRFVTESTRNASVITAAVFVVLIFAALIQRARNNARVVRDTWAALSDKRLTGV